ncbi:MAG: tetratricopeptide repeat protein, partial [Aridibacter famidurans]|nr:tetratricopeptide repeat protein [Aridibacter famidurans]
VISLAETGTLISEARKAEACRDAELLKEILAPIWPDIEGPPDIPDLEPAEEGELLRLCGCFLGYYGHLNAKPDYQERGKDLLSQAIDVFESAGLDEEAARAGLNLAWRYLQQGSHDEAEAIVDYTKSKIGNRRSSTVYLRLKLFDCVTLSSAGHFQKALKCVTALKPAMEKTDDPAVRAQYHIEAAFVCAETDRLAEALEHYQNAEKFAKALGNERFEAIILGNIAFVLLKQKKYARALKQIEKAISLNRNRTQNGFLAHNFDTKAQALLGKKDPGRALLAIDTSLELFRQGEDFAGHCEAIFNKLRILLKLGETEEVLMLFAELVDLARTRISENAARRYAARFEELFFLPKARGYKAEVSEFKKFILREALIEANLLMKDAAKDLNISQAMLSDILRRQFPELFDELGIKKRKSRKMKK